MSHYTRQFLFNRTFNGFCAGVTAKLNSSCELIELSVDDTARNNFYEVSNSSSAAATDSNSNNDNASSNSTAADDIATKALGGANKSSSSSSPPTGEANNKRQIVDSKKLAKAIEMAIWDATRKVKAAKEEYYHLSVKNARLLVASKELVGEAPEATEAELATIRDFSQYGLSVDSALLAPNPWNSLRDRSPYHVILNSPNYLLKETTAAAGANNKNGADATASPSSATELAKDFAPTRPITLCDILPEYKAAFLSYPSSIHATITDTAAGKRTTSNNISEEKTNGAHDGPTATAEQRKASALAAAAADKHLAMEELRHIKATAAGEEAADELAFWTRVEGIRKGQQAVLGATLNKRPYKDQAGAIPVSDFDEKIALKFIQ